MFGAGMTVTIGGVAATNLRVQSATTVLATAGPHDAGPVDVAVSLDGKSATLPGGFTYMAPAAGTLPVITGFTTQGSQLGSPQGGFVEAGDEITVTVVLQSPGTPPDGLTFEWSAESGTITGSGPSVRWRAPASRQVVTPANVKITVKITKTIDVVLPYPSASIVSVSGNTSVVLHDSVKEVSDLSVLFLEDFSNSSLPAAVRHAQLLGRMPRQGE